MRVKALDQDGEGCVRIFAWMLFAILCTGIGMGVLFTILLNIWL